MRVPLFVTENVFLIMNILRFYSKLINGVNLIFGIMNAY